MPASVREVDVWRILVVDDHEIVRSGIARALAAEADLRPCGAAADAGEALARARELRPDVAVVDVNLPGASGSSLVQALRSLPSPPAVVVFTMLEEDVHALGFLRAGASAFLNKRRTSAELLRAVRRAAQGGRYVTAELAELLVEHELDLDRPAHEQLSEREVQVVRALAAGRRSVEVAAELGLSASTVNTYVARIKLKLGVRTLVELGQYAREHGLA